MTQKRIAVIPVIQKRNGYQICLVTSRDRQKWIIPTGKQEKHLSDRKVAELEAYEEAGVRGRMEKGFSMTLTIASPSGRKKRKTRLYMIRVKEQLKDWPEKHQRRRKLVDVDKLDRFVCDKKLGKTIRRHLV